MPTIWWEIIPNENAALPLQEIISVGPLSEAIITPEKAS